MHTLEHVHILRERVYKGKEGPKTRNKNIERSLENKDIIKGRVFVNNPGDRG